MNKKGGLLAGRTFRIIWMVIALLAIIAIFALFFTDIGEGIRRFDFW